MSVEHVEIVQSFGVLEAQSLVSCGEEQSLQAPDVRSALLALLAYAHEEGGLPTKAAWVLDRLVSEAITQRSSMQPVGGWPSLAALAAGSGWFCAHATRFEPAIALEDVQKLSNAQVRRTLCEAFTRALVPPVAAAALCIMIGLHPAWALFVCHRAYQRAGEEDEAAEHAHESARMFDPAVARVVESAVFAVMDVVIRVLRDLDPAQRYAVHDFAQLVAAACQVARQQIQLAADARGGLSLQPLLTMSAEPMHEAEQFVCRDLFGAVMVPAGIVQVVDKKTFCVFEDAFDWS